MKPFEVERWFAEYEFKAAYNLAESCIQPLRLTEISALTDVPPLELVGDEPLGYVDAAGSPDLRQAIAGVCHASSPDEVLVTAGAIEANFLLHTALIQSGDVVICQYPAYQQLYEVARWRGAEVRFWMLRRENSYKPDLDELRALATGRVKLIVLNNPHNPTGSVLDESQLREAFEIAASCGALVHVDEVYSGINHTQIAAESRSISDRAIVTGSMSKAYGLSGARLGWVVGAREIVLECAKLRDYVSICPSYIGERLSLALLRNRHKVLSRSNQIASTNFEIVKNWMAEKEHLIRWVAPQAGVVCFPWFAKPLDSMQACTRLIEQCSVLLVPGTCFAHPEHVRLGFGYSTPKLVEGLELFGQFLESNM